MMGDSNHPAPLSTLSLILAEIISQLECRNQLYIFQAFKSASLQRCTDLEEKNSCLGGFNHKSHLAATTVSMVQVDSSYLFPESNGPYALPHYRYQRLQVPSRGQSVRARCAHQNFFGSKRQFLRARRESSRVQVSSLKAVVCRMQDGQVSEQEREEARWLREEKRWLREEERWLREEARWDAERKALLEQSLALKEEIKVLKREFAGLESQVKDEKLKDGSISDLIVNLSSLLQSLNIASALQTDGQELSSVPAQISSSASSATDISATLGDISLGIPTTSIGVGIPVGQSSILESKGASTTTSSSYGRNKRTLKRGAEGDDVKAMQDALAKLGFYSGEDDMEYSTFSSGTDRAVRSWQATLGTSEDGIVTTELLIKLLGEETPSVAEKKKTASSPSQDGTNPSVKATVPPSTTGVKGLASPGVKVQGSAAPGAKAEASVSSGLRAQSSSSEKPGSTFVEVSQKRVYLLGENRWEEPNRLLNRNGPAASASATAMVVLGEKCFSCKGVGNMMCTECEGTGDLNVEEQFLEWAEEGAKCPYCEGKGMLICDVCDGKGVQVPS